MSDNSTLCRFTVGMSESLARSSPPSSPSTTHTRGRARAPSASPARRNLTGRRLLRVATPRGEDGTDVGSPPEPPAPIPRDAGAHHLRGRHRRCLDDAPSARRTSQRAQPGDVDADSVRQGQPSIGSARPGHRAELRALLPGLPEQAAAQRASRPRATNRLTHRIAKGLASAWPCSHRRLALVPAVHHRVGFVSEEVDELECLVQPVGGG